MDARTISCLQKNAVIFITTHGKTSLIRLSEQEKKDFNNGKLIEHKFSIEGNRLYATYQPKVFFESLSKKVGFVILNHIERGIQNGKPTQDIWLLKKP